MTSINNSENSVTRERIVDPFFKTAIDNIFIHSDKNLFAMDGAVGTGKTSEFTVRGAYTIACNVRPIKKGKRMVRESKWAMIRESENSAYNTMYGILTEAIFSPDIVALNPDLITTTGTHPKRIHVCHALPDGTELEMITECHGFNNEQAHNRLRTHEFLGAMIPELQGIPWNIVTTAIARCGRWRAETLFIDREIDGKLCTLTGVNNLKIVLADVNIPERPHPLYTEWYDLDIEEQKRLPFMFQTPPQPIIPIPVERVSNPDIFDKYPQTHYLGEDVVWIPNPKAYNLTRHFEEKDENGVNIPWTGFKYWLNMVFDTDSAVTRYVIGKKDTVSGKAAIYKFAQNERSVCGRNLDPDRPIYIGFDPGANCGVTLLQWFDDNHLHFFKEFVFKHEDNVSTREVFGNFVIPYLRDNFSFMDVIIIPDPAASWLQKSKSANNVESAKHVLLMVTREANVDPSNTNRYRIVPPQVANQQTDIRINSLKYFIEQGKISIDPEGCPTFLMGLMGDYRRKIVGKGYITDEVDKHTESCDVVESAQYPCINILKSINDKRDKEIKNKNKVVKRQGAAKKARR